MEQPPKIVQQRLRETQKPGVHPDSDLLAAFAEKSLNDREHSVVLRHLADCADCREAVSLAMPEIKAAPSLSATRSPWLSWPMLRWGALAVCVVVVGAAVTLHYDRRRSVEPYLSEQVPAAPAPAAMPDSEVPQQSNQKLAAKIATPSPLQSDRDFGTAAGKLAKQREKNAEIGALAGTQVPVPHGTLADRNENTPELTNNRLTNNRLASSNALKSADKPSSPAGRLVAAAPVPAPSIKTAGAEPGASRAQSVTREDALDSAARTTETVAAAVPMAQTAERNAKDESNKKGLNEEELSKEALHREIQAARVAAPGADSLGDRKRDSLAGQKAQTASGGYAEVSGVGSYAATRWTLSAGGVPQRSFDSGKTWQSVPVASNVVFRALAANDSDVWVGGAAGALYHSSDAGQHWIKVKPVVDGKPLTADITAIEFRDSLHGRLTTANREIWITDDAGDTWQLH